MGHTAAEHVLQNRHSEALAESPRDVVLRLSHFARNVADRHWLMETSIDDCCGVFDDFGRFDTGSGYWSSRSRRAP